MVEKVLDGEFVWIKTSKDRPEEFVAPDGTVKKSWSATIYPDKDSLELIRELQAIGIKNKLKKDDKGWHAKFSCPVEEVKKGKVVRVNDPPLVVDASGNVIDGFVNNGAIGSMKIDFKEGSTPKGKYYVARLQGLKLTDYKLWESTGDAKPMPPKASVW